MLPQVFDGFWYFIALIVAMICWRIWGQRFVDAVRRFDQRRRDADLQLFYDRMNPNAHFRQSVDQINDATPAVEATGHDDGARWNGTDYASREEAEAARWRHVLTQAREFYQDVDRTFGQRLKHRRSDSVGEG
jgi:hypothetical protein